MNARLPERTEPAHHGSVNEERFDVRSADGTSLAVWVDGDGPALVMVHGSIADHTTFEPFVAVLRDSVTTYSMDRRGFGASGDTAPYAIDRDFEDVAAVVDAVAARTGGPVALWGHSYGANCAMGGAALSDNVSRLVLYEPSFGMPYPPGSIARVEDALARGDHDAAITIVLVDILEVTDEEMDAFRASPLWPVRLAAAPTVARECHAEEDWVYRPGQFDAVTAPTLMLAGSDSVPVVAEATTLAAAAIPQPRSSCSTGTGTSPTGPTRRWSPTSSSGSWHRYRPVAKAPATEIDVGGRTVRITNPDRVYFPATGATKLDLVDYYLAVGPGIVNALRERPCMLHRFPTGVSGEKVHQKRVPAGAPPWLQTVRVHFPRYGLHADELCVTELAEVIWAVQMSTVEFHPWNSRRADTEKPDEWRIDLDPMPECTLDTVRRVAGVAHEVLDELGAVGWPKTSGGRGPARLRAHRAVARVQRRAPRRAGLRPRGRAPRRRHGDDDVVAQGPRPGGGLRRLQPERPRPHDRCGVLRARRARRHRLDADHVGRGRRRRAG